VSVVQCSTVIYDVPLTGDVHMHCLWDCSVLCWSFLKFLSLYFSRIFRAVMLVVQECIHVVGI